MDSVSKFRTSMQYFLHYETILILICIYFIVLKNNIDNDAMSTQTSYQILEEKKIYVKQILEFHIKSVINILKRRITFREKYKNPWRAEAEVLIQFDIFYNWYKSIEDYTTSFGRTLEVVRSKNRKAKHFKIEFNHLGSLNLHLEKITGYKVSDLLWKKNKKSGAKAKLLVNTEKRAIIDYKVSTGIMKMSVYYEAKNRYGIVCSV